MQVDLGLECQLNCLMYDKTKCMQCDGNVLSNDRFFIGVIESQRNRTEGAGFCLKTRKFSSNKAPKPVLQ